MVFILFCIKWLNSVRYASCTLEYLINSMRIGKWLRDTVYLKSVRSASANARRSNGVMCTGVYGTVLQRLGTEQRSLSAYCGSHGPG